MNKVMGAAPTGQVPTHGCCDCCMATALAELLGWHQNSGTTTGLELAVGSEQGLVLWEQPYMCTQSLAGRKYLHLPVCFGLSQAERGCLLMKLIAGLHSLDGSRLSPQDFLLQREHWAGLLRWEGHDPNPTPQPSASSVPSTLEAQHSPS